MLLSKLTFLIFSSSLILSSFSIILVNNPIYSVLFMILSFISAVSILVLLESEFLSLILIVIYLGAIAVLFLFVVMMLNIKIIDSVKDMLKYFPIGNLISFIIAIVVFSSFTNTFEENPYSESFLFNNYTNWFDKLDSLIDIKALGQIIYTYYAPQFLVSGLILLIAVVGAVILTISHKETNHKSQETFKQVSR
jgi:NADH-quinone oxidoreductase subunit J